MHPPTRQFRSSRTAAGLLLATVLMAGLAACGEGADSSEVAARRTVLEQQRLQLLNQFAAAQNEVRNTQTRALDDPSIESLRERFYSTLREHMILVDPRAEARLDRAKELGARIDELSTPLILEQGQEPPDDDRAGVMREFADLEKALRPAQNRAMADPQVAAAFQAMQDSVHALMIRMNPDAESAIDRMKRTSEAVDSLDAEIAALGS